MEFSEKKTHAGGVGNLWIVLSVLLVGGCTGQLRDDIEIGAGIGLLVGGTGFFLLLGPNEDSDSDRRRWLRLVGLIMAALAGGLALAAGAHSEVALALLVDAGVGLAILVGAWIAWRLIVRGIREISKSIATGVAEGRTEARKPDKGE